MGKLARCAATVGLALAIVGVRPALAQDEAFATGLIIEDVAAPQDPSQTFSLYLPSAYSPDDEWPIVFLMDPRGRSLFPLRKLVPTAERLGYILASSNNTASDVDHDPNTPAINAMIATLQPRLSLDLRRFYLFGMSGTARVAWALAYDAAPHVAGVAGFGAGLPSDFNLESVQGQYGAPFVFYGGAGDHDFNHAELVLLEYRLRRLGFRYTASYYPGRHGWPQQESEYDAALSWMHLMAMQRDLVEVDTAWVRASYLQRLSTARRLEEEGAPALAWKSYKDLEADFDGLFDQTEAADRAAILTQQPEATAWRSRRLDLARAHMAYKGTTAVWLRDAQSADPDLKSALEALAIDSLKAATQDFADPDGSAAATRALADLFSLTSFYYTRYHMDREDWGRARLTLEISNTIFPGTRRVCGQLDQVYAALGHDRDAAPAEGCGSTGP